jgi:hypothetical protein
MKYVFLFINNNLWRYSLYFEVGVYEIMTEENVTKSNKGLSIGSNAPIIDTKDIYNNEIALNILFKRFKGILIDFFRGAW